ncbi:hypothetical protein ACJMK2_003725 [Sinanodonta woodiana]|uniref:Uncharacterized protein n=1 Tax=Sinanodonta woodiana TaxID=1069815 RepID=A0ABD3Y282_SINWO
MIKKSRQFPLGPDYKITPYQYKPYKTNIISNTFRESKKVTFKNDVYDKNKDKIKMGSDIPVREHKYVPKEPIYNNIYVDTPRIKNGARAGNIKQSNAEVAQTITATKTVKEIQTSFANPTPIKEIDSQIWKTPPRVRNSKEAFVPPLTLGESETPGRFPGHTGCMECHSINFGFKSREFTERVVIKSPAPEYEPSETREMNFTTLDRSCLWTPIGSSFTSATSSGPQTPPSPETNVVPPLAFRHALPYQSYGLSHPNLVRGKFRAETPVLKGRHPRTLSLNGAANKNSVTKITLMKELK